MQIVTKGLKYSYDIKSKFKSDALNGIDLTINEGDFMAIIGKTGSGKSTLVQHLNGLIKIQKNSGSIVIGDYDLADKDCDFRSLRAKVGMVFQYPEYQLFAESVFEDVAFGLKNFKPEMSEQDVKSAVKSALEIVGLNYFEVADKSPFDLSGGQKRRVAIAGVLVTRPEILVLDEPVAGLDPRGKEDLLNLLHAVHNDFVKTIIIVSHDMDIVAEHCNKVAVMNGGKVVAYGTPKEVFADKDAITSAGLELPLTAYLMERLLEVGVKVDSDLTEENFIKALLQEVGV